MAAHLFQVAGHALKRGQLKAHFFVVGIDVGLVWKRVQVGDGDEKHFHANEKVLVRRCQFAGLRVLGTKRRREKVMRTERRREKRGGARLQHLVGLRRRFSPYLGIKRFELLSHCKPDALRERSGKAFEYAINF
jgi:hypothetical protein